MKKLNSTYFTVAVYALAVIAFSIVFLMLCINFGAITATIGDFLSAIASILYGILFAFLLFPAVKRFDSLFEKLFSRKKPHPLLVSGFSIGVTLLLALGVVAALLIVIIPRLITDAGELYRFIMETKGRLDEFVAANAVAHPFLTELYEGIAALLFSADAESSLIDSLIASLTGVLTAVVGQISSIFMGLFIAIYLLASRRVISGITGKLVVAIIPERHVNRFVLFFKRLYTDFASFAFNRFVIAFFFAGAVLLIGLLLQVPLLSVVVLLVLLSQLIPVIGPIVGITASILLFTILKSPLWGLLYAAIILALEFFSTNVWLPQMLPKKLRPSYGVTAVVVLLSLSIFGVIGAFVAIPIYATLNIEVRRFLIHRLAKKNLPISSEAYRDFNAAHYEALSTESAKEEENAPKAEETDAEETDGEQ